jgi:glutamine synthetase
MSIQTPQDGARTDAHAGAPPPEARSAGGGTRRPSAGALRGRLTREALLEALADETLETVLVAFPDLYGRLVGKRITAPFFLDHVAEDGVHACDYLLACDMEMDPVPGYRFTSWETGYGDLHCVLDWSTARIASWLPKSAIVLCDVVNEHTGALLEVAPRSVLRRQLERAAALGYRAMGASELELFVMRDSYETAHTKGYRDLATFGTYVEDYHLLSSSRVEPLIGEIRRKLEASAIPVEFSKGEWGPGQHEINLRYAEMLEMSDRHVLYKHAAKDIASAMDLAVTFMAKWHSAHAGNSFHLHASLWDANDPERALFCAGDGDDVAPIEGTRARPSALFRHWMAGILAHAREITLFYAPLVNSYKRYVAGSFAPTAIGWAYDNRTAGVRVVGHGSALRTECRFPGGDANPYLAYAATLAAGFDGIARKLEPPPMFKGDLYQARDLPQIPRSLPEAIACAERSELLREAFGDAVLEHYLHFARTEQQAFDRAVTTWERARYLERA